MEKLVLFPLNEDTEVLINNLRNSEQYQTVAVSSYYEDKKRLELLQEKNSFYCSTDFEKCLGEADAVVFAENTMEYDYEGYKERINQAQKSMKKIYISVELLEKLGLDIEKDNFNILQEKSLLQDLGETKIKEIDIPIISIMGMGENCDKFNLQVKAKEVIEKKGYNVLAISSNVLGKFLGMEVLPGFLYSKNISYPEKIKYFNVWVYQLQKQKRADVILLGCPSGISEFEDYETNFYAEIPLIISKAISIDAGLLTLYANMGQNAETIKKLSDFLMVRFDTEVKEFVVSKQYFKADYECQRIRYYKICERDDSQFNINDTTGYHISYIENDLEVEDQIKTIINKLENNFHVI